VIDSPHTYNENSTMAKKPIPLDAALRKAIKASGLTHYALAKEANVQATTIDRFMHPADDPRHRDIRLETAAKIAAVLGLGLVKMGGE
jgi:plasmid maintenance system antidote protein VapI